MANKTQKFQYIDSLRGIAILAVLLVHCHFYGRNQYPSYFVSLFNHGDLGVQLFFIISAFTLCLSFDKRLLQEKHPVRNFYLRRLFRVVPLFYLALIYYLFFFTGSDRSVLAIPTAINPLVILSTLTFTHGLFPSAINTLVPGGWSLAVEMGFYLIFPFLFRYINSLRRSVLFGFVTALAYQVFYYLVYKHPVFATPLLWQQFLYYFLPSQLPIFLIGFMLFHLSTTKFSQLKFTQKDNIFIQLVLLLTIIQLASISIFPYHFLYSLLFGFGIYLLSIHPTRFFVNRFTAYIGKISFSLYLVHFAILKYLSLFNLVDFVNQGLLNFSLRYLLLLVLGTALASLTYFLIEVPFIRLGQKLINRLEIEH